MSMPHITLVRHGQANSDAKDEDGYDKLSDLGHQQARWLGEHFDHHRRNGLPGSTPAPCGDRSKPPTSMGDRAARPTGSGYRA